MFTPFGFRSAPAWGGVALMPFVLMQFTFALKVCLSEAAINMGIFCAVAFKDWFRYQFIKPEFYPSQWGLVCVLVGLEVLAVYSHSNYYASALLLGFSYLSIALAAAIYTFVYLKFVGVIKVRKS